MLDTAQIHACTFSSGEVRSDIYNYKHTVVSRGFFTVKPLRLFQISIYYFLLIFPHQTSLQHCGCLVVKAPSVNRLHWACLNGENNCLATHLSALVYAPSHSRLSMSVIKQNFLVA